MGVGVGCGDWNRVAGAGQGLWAGPWGLETMCSSSSVLYILLGRAHDVGRSLLRELRSSTATGRASLGPPLLAVGAWGVVGPPPLKPFTAANL